MIVGRYVIGETFASGGMGTVHLGRIRGAGGFSRVVAVKRLYPWLARDGEFRQMLLDEARFVSRIRHPNVVPTLDVVEADQDLYVVMEYVHGVSLAHLVKHCQTSGMPVNIAAGIVEGVLSGLHAAHEARGEDGMPLGIVHRDVSPQNILVGADGIARLIDFGIAKAATRLQVTDPGVVKGKIGYMAPEQLLREPVSRQADVYSCGVVLWEVLANRRLSDAHGDDARRVRQSEDVPPSRFSGDVNAKLDALVLRALSLEPKARFPNADAMAVALRDACVPAAPAEIARWLRDVVGDDLEISDERVRLVELAAADSSQELLSPHVLPEARESNQGTTDVEPTGRRVWVARVAKVGGALILTAAAALALGAAWHRSVAAAAAASGANSTPAASPSAPATTATQIAASSPTDHSPAAPSVSSSAPSVAPPATAASRTPNSRVHQGSKGHRCDPPYSVDASGRKHYDPNCF